MTTSFTLILVFLGLYLPKVAGGGTREFVLESAYAWVPLWDWIYYAYLLMLAIHIILPSSPFPSSSTPSSSDLPTRRRSFENETPHRRVGRIAASAWLLSLVLGVVTYLMLNHAYDSTFAAAEAAAMLLPVGPGRSAPRRFNPRPPRQPTNTGPVHRHRNA